MPTFPDPDVHLVTSLNKWYYIYNKLHKAKEDVRTGRMGKAAIQEENAKHAKAPNLHSWAEDQEEAKAALLELVGEAIKVIEAPAPPAPALRAVGSKARPKSVARRRRQQPSNHTKANEDGPYLDLEEASRYTGISIGKLSSKVRSGKIPKQNRRDNRIKIPLAALSQERKAEETA